MTLRNTLKWLEQEIYDDGEHLPAGIPAAWCEYDADGTMIGPPGDTALTPAQQATWGELVAMDAGIPMPD